MDRIYGYLLKNFFKNLLTYFGIFFLLLSIINFVRIAGYTTEISMSFADIFRLYFYVIPQLVIYVLPLTYFIAMVLTFNNFSKDGEMLVLFSLGKSPKSVLSFFLFVSFVISLFLVVNSLVFMPRSEQMSDNFLEIKKVESKINIRTSEVGQKIGKWNIFSKQGKGDVYRDLALFSKDRGKSQIILANEAKLVSGKREMSLMLDHGTHYRYDSLNDSLIKTKYEKLKFTYNLHKGKLDTKGIVDFWLEAKTNSNRAKWLLLYLLFSFLPFFGVAYAFSIGIINPRVQKRAVGVWITVVIFIYYFVAYNISVTTPLVGGIVFAVSFFVLGLIFVKKMILNRY